MSCRFEPALSNLLAKPFCDFPDTAVGMLKASGPCHSLISLWKSLLTAIGSDLERRADGGDNPKTAFRNALTYLAVHVDSSTVLAMLPTSVSGTCDPLVWSDRLAVCNSGSVGGGVGVP